MSSQQQMTMTDIRNWIDYSMFRKVHEWLPDKQNWTQPLSQWEDHTAETIPFSDKNAAEEIYSVFGDKIHYLPGLNAWHVWNGVFHEKISGDLLAPWMCHAFVNAHLDALRRVKNHYIDVSQPLAGDAKARKMKEYIKDKFGPHRQYRDRIHNTSGLSGLTAQIKIAFSVQDDFFTNDFDWLVVQNGVIDLKALQENPPGPNDLRAIPLLEHDPSRPVYRAVNASFDPNGDFSSGMRWRNFLQSSIPDGSLQRFLAVTTGAAFLGAAKTKTIPVLLGRKNSGKTIFIDTIHQLAQGYGAQPDTSAINRASGQNFEQDAFRGIRFAAITEPNTDRKVDDSFLKKFTGGDILSTRTLHSKPIYWKSQGVLFIATNKPLKFDVLDEAILTRFATVSFPYRFFPPGQLPPNRPDYFQWDPDLERDLLDDLDGVLVWVLQGMLIFLNENIVIPESITDDRRFRYIEDNSVHLWLEEAVKANDEIFVLDETTYHTRSNSDFASVSDAHLQYSIWCSQEVGENPKGQREFTKTVCNYLDVTPVKSSSMRIPKLIYRDRIEELKDV